MPSTPKPSSSIGVIAGTNLSSIFGQQVREVSVDTPFGTPSANFVLTSVSERMVWSLERHGNIGNIKAFDVNYRANIWALKELGVKQILSTATVGSIDPEFEVGDIVIPDQIIDYTYGREHTFVNDQPLTSIEFTYPFSAQLRKILCEVLESYFDGASRTKGTYGCTQGPRLETAAEINRMRQDGCDLVGMTAMPEAALAREIGIEYATVCLVVNLAAGVDGKSIAMQDIAKITRNSLPVVGGYLERVLQLIK